MPYSVGMVSLGCEKNRVDAEIMMASLEKAGFVLKDDAALADVAIVNTCGFIESAKQESIEEILELARLKQEGRIRALVVAGCMAERYREEIRRELPEADVETLMVIDATTGQNGLIQAKQFADTADITGIVLTKLDGTARGGIVFAIAREMGVPVKYVGVGEGMDDLMPFEPKSFSEALLS